MAAAASRTVQGLGDSGDEVRAPCDRLRAAPAIDESADAEPNAMNRAANRTTRLPIEHRDAISSNPSNSSRHGQGLDLSPQPYR